MKKLVVTFFVLGLVFFIGYRLGIHKNNEYTIAYMQNLSDQVAASKSIISIEKLDRIRSMENKSDEVSCALQKEIIRISDDFKKCKSNDACISKIKADYAAADSLILNLDNNKCK